MTNAKARRDALSCKTLQSLHGWSEIQVIDDVADRQDAYKYIDALPFRISLLNYSLLDNLHC
jgi:hypothetical protein